MTKWRRIVELNRQHPEWHDQEIADAVNCAPAYVRQICVREGLTRGKKPRKPYTRNAVTARSNTITVRVDDEMEAWLYDEAERLGDGVKVRDVVVAILRDARAGD